MVKLDLPEGRVHLRKSNTEPIVRVYAEADTEAGFDPGRNLPHRPAVRA